MRLLRINNIDVEIDDKTAIGIDLQSYDVKNPGNTYINTSNSFTVPATVNNLAIIGHANNPQSQSTIVYEEALCDYWVDNELLIEGAKVRVEGVTDRIEFFIYEKKSFWDDLKKDLWPDFMDDFLIWLNTEKSLPIQSDPYTGIHTSFLNPYTIATEGVLFPFYYGNMAEYISVGQKHIEYQTADSGYSGGAGLTLTVTIDSFVIPGAPIVVGVTFVPGIPLTSTQVAERIASRLNANTSITEYYEASFVGDRTYLTSKEAIFDPDLNIAYTGTAIPNKPTSITEQEGVSVGINFVETVYQPNGIIVGDISLRQKTVDENSQGGHFCIYARTIFEYIESRYNISLLVSGGVLPGNIWDDIVAQKLYTPIRDLAVYMSASQCYFYLDRTSSFLPHKNQKDKADKTVYDLVKSFMNEMNVLKDELKVGNEKIIRFARFDDLKTVADVKDFSDKFTGVQKFIPKVEGFGQNNYIKYKEIYPEGDGLLNSKKLQSLNQNLDINKDLFEIDAYVPSTTLADGDEISYMGDKESFKTFTWYLSDETTAKLVIVKYYDFTTSPQTIYNLNYNLQIAKLYDLNSEYNFLDEIITYPKVYEAKKWLTIEDIRNFEFFKQYFIRDLNGSFFVNKIKGFNPLSKQPTTLELIRLGNRTPITPPDANPWVDGVGAIWDDGEVDYWY
jgi:hypothetical protein